MEIQNLTFTNGLTFTSDNPICSVVTNGLAVQLRPDSYPGSGTIWNDTQGNVNGTLINNPTYNNTTGFFFPQNTGQAQGVVLSSINGFTNFDRGTYSIEFWIRAASVSTNGNIVWKSFTQEFQPTPIPSPYIANWPGDFVNVVTWDAVGGGTNITTQTLETLMPSVWYQIVATFDFNSLQMKLYVNGKQVPVVGNLADTVGTNGNNYPLYLARTNQNFSHAFAGDIGIFRIYNKALTLREVKANFCADRSIFGL